MTNDIVFDDALAIRISNTVELVKYNKYENNKKDFFLKTIKMSNYSSVFYFVDFFVVSYFDKLFVFNYSSFSEYVKADDYEQFFSDHAICMIYERKMVSNEDFENLKKCYMLTKNISYVEGKIYCSYKPYYMIKLTLKGESLLISLITLNAETEINMNNVNIDLKTFINEVFDGIPEDKLKIYHKILIYYANELK